MRRASRAPSTSTSTQPTSPDAAPVPVPVKPAPVADDAEEPISLVDSGEDGMHKIRARSANSPLGDAKTEYKRPVNLTGQGATRCKLFHARIAIAPLERMEQVINEWLDDEELEVKHVGTVIGIMEGKTPEPNLLTFVWY